MGSRIEVSRLENWLGLLAAGYPRCWRWMGDQETRWYASRLPPEKIERPVYITGLARSGTTILLECLAAHEQVATHQYRDYPFVHTPIWWNRFLDRAGKEDGPAVERFHQDRIRITSRSPEAMEEILWMSFFPDCHSPQASHVFENDASYPVFEAFLRAHIRKLLFLRGGSRYVAKANYHITRLGYVKALFPDVRFIVPVRSPQAHIASLSRQHRHFCQREREDPRLLAYMRRSGHFEFGLDRRPVHTGKIAMENRIRRLWAEEREVSGLALLWRSVYQYLVDLLRRHDDLREKVLLVSYEDLCRAPVAVLGRIYDHCGLAVSEQIIADQAAAISAPDYYDGSFSKEESGCIDMETRDVYEQILSITTQP